MHNVMIIPSHLLFDSVEYTSFPQQGLDGKKCKAKSAPRQWHRPPVGRLREVKRWSWSSDPPLIKGILSPFENDNSTLLMPLQC